LRSQRGLTAKSDIGSGVARACVMLARCKLTAAAHERTTMAWPHLGAFASVQARPSQSQAASAPALRVQRQSRGCRRRAHQEARAPRAHWPMAVASECASTGTPRRHRNFLLRSHVAWHATWALSVATACLVSIWGQGDRGTPGRLLRAVSITEGQKDLKFFFAQYPSHRMFDIYMKH
jgi:hypothetical protein